jgi:hypothetical protein
MAGAVYREYFFRPPVQDSVGELLNVAAELASGVILPGETHAGGKLRRYIQEK